MRKLMSRADRSHAVSIRLTNTAFGAFALTICMSAAPTLAQTQLPRYTTNAGLSCYPAEQLDYSGPSMANIGEDYGNNQPTPGGFTLPPQGLNTTINSFCAGMTHAMRTFLWVTSPTDNGNGYIFDSPQFFDVSNPDAHGKYTLLPIVPGATPQFHVRDAKPGAHGLPVVMDKTGHMFTVLPTSRDAKPKVRSATGQLTTIAHAKRSPAGLLTLLDGNGARVDFGPRLPRPPAGPNPPVALCDDCVNLFDVDNIAVYIDPWGSVVDIAAGQVGGGVLMAQPQGGAQYGSLVYYSIEVNDVIAYMATAAAAGVITGSNGQPLQFPTTQAQLNAIESFATSQGKAFAFQYGHSDKDALAVEIKASWVEASAVPSNCSYITRTATIPTYDTSNPNEWVPNGSKTTTMALVGMHVVSSVAGHPEMIWSTFEHICNSPQASYYYAAGPISSKVVRPRVHHYDHNDSGSPQDTILNVAQDTSGTWLFASKNSYGPYNLQHMQLNGDNIVAVNLPFGDGTFTVSPSDTLRTYPWGDNSSNANAELNAGVLAMNADSFAYQVSSDPKDPRRNYFLIGATWTTNGTPPANNNQQGTTQLANSTMETYVQGSNCLSCHQSQTRGRVDTGMSHIFANLYPLFQAQGIYPPATNTPPNKYSNSAPDNCQTPYSYSVTKVCVIQSPYAYDQAPPQALTK